MPFQIHALPFEPFAHLFDLDEQQLRDRNARRVEVTQHPGSPCRVSLVDAAVGERAILLNYEHQPADSPFRASHAIYVREGAEQARPAPGELPELLRVRPISLRAFDEAGDMIGADLARGDAVRDAIERLLENPRVEYLHLHSALPGCYVARATRA